MSDWNDLKEKLASFALVDDCETLADGSLRFTTPFLYPDGSPVHIFYQQSNDLFLTARLTDGGQSAAFLAGLQVQIENHEKREQILSAICRTLGVRSHEGELTVHLASDDELARGIVQLAQACVRDGGHSLHAVVPPHVGLPPDFRGLSQTGASRPHRGFHD